MRSHLLAIGAFAALARFGLGQSGVTAPLPSQMSADDKMKLQVLHDLLLGIQREPVRWRYLVVDRDVSRWTDARVQAFLNEKAVPS